MSVETPFSIAVPGSELEYLRRKLELTRFPDELENAGTDYGAPLADIRRLTKYWQDTYLPQWREHEAKLNKDLPQFTRDIEVDGFGLLNIHYVHKKSEVADAIPLLFVHGCEYNFAFLCLLAHFEMVPRARKFRRSIQNHASAPRSFSRPPKLSCRSPKPSGLRLLWKSQEKGLRGEPVRRGVQQTHGGLGLQRVRYPRGRLGLGDY